MKTSASRPGCARCHAVLHRGDMAWLTSRPAAKVKLDGRVERFDEQMLLCDPCGMQP